MQSVKVHHKTKVTHHIEDTLEPLLVHLDAFHNLLLAPVLSNPEHLVPHILLVLRLIVLWKRVLKYDLVDEGIDRVLDHAM